MLAVAGGRRPACTWRIPAGFAERYSAVAASVTAGSVDMAGGNLAGVSRDMFLQALHERLPDLSADEEDYVRQVSLVVLQQMRGSTVYMADLDYLDASLRQGRVPPQEVGSAPPTLTRSLFATQTMYGTKTIDICKTTGVSWRIPKGFLKRYNAANQQVLRTAAAIAMEVKERRWSRVTPDSFLEACRQVLGELSADEEDYVMALALEQVPAGTDFIRDLPYFDKCLQQGRTPTAIKGPTLLPTIFLNDTTSIHAKEGGGSLLLRHTGGRAY